MRKDEETAAAGTMFSIGLITGISIMVLLLLVGGCASAVGSNTDYRRAEVAAARLAQCEKDPRGSIVNKGNRHWVEAALQTNGGLAHVCPRRR